MKLLAAAGVASTFNPALSYGEARHSSAKEGAYAPAKITNEYDEFLQGERDALSTPPAIAAADSTGVHLRNGDATHRLSIGEFTSGWHLLAVIGMNGTPTAVFEKHVTHRGAIAFVTADRETIALIPKGIGDLANIRPRKIAAPADVQLRRPARYIPGPDIPGKYILNSNEDPCYENVAALGPEYIGWTLVANEQGGPMVSLFLNPDGTSRELNNDPPQASWAPDELGAIFDPKSFLPNDNEHLWNYEEGFSKRTLLGGYTPAADIGVRYQQYQCGYEAMVVLPDGVDARPIARVRILLPEDQITPGMLVYRDAQNRAYIDRYLNGDAHSFFSTVAGVWNH